MNYASPIVGLWYRCDAGSLFEVVALDEQAHTIEVQHFDGTLEEFDEDGWAALVAEEADAPEDWTGSVDIDHEDHDEPARAPLWLGDSPIDRDECDGFSELRLT